MNWPIIRSGFIFILVLFSISKSEGQISGGLKIKGIPRELVWENKPKRFQVTPTSLQIISGEKTDMFRDPNVTYNTDNAPKLLFEADSNFVFTASVEHAFASKWDGGALVIKQDSLNWVKCCFEKDYTGAKRVVSVVTKGISDDCNSVEIKANKVYFKIAKANNVITLYYSITGKSWYLFRHFTLDTSGPFKIGFLSQSPTGTECTVTFRDIYYSPKKIKDPYGGE